MYFVGETLNLERTKVITKAKGILENCCFLLVAMTSLYLSLIDNFKVE
jgi:hypothetical protein